MPDLVVVMIPIWHVANTQTHTPFDAPVNNSEHLLPKLYQHRGRDDMTTEDNNSSDSYQFYTYRCSNDEDVRCAEVCVSLGSCQNDCGSCVVIVDGQNDNDDVDATADGGTNTTFYGYLFDVTLCLFPVIFLIYSTVKTNPMSTPKSLPIAAILMIAIRMMYLGSDPHLIFASIIKGLHESLVPITIMSGSMLLLETMEATYCLPYMMREIKALTTGHAIAELMLMYAFLHVIAGASGFGAVAVSAPMLVANGHHRIRSIVVLLIFEIISCTWGTIGVPIWLGFGPLELSDQELLDVSAKVALAMTVAGFVVVPISLTMFVSWDCVQRNMCFILYSLLSTTGTTAAIAAISYEFPALLGGVVGCVVVGICIVFDIGIQKRQQEQQPKRGQPDKCSKSSVLRSSSLSLSRSSLHFDENNHNVSDDDEGGDEELQGGAAAETEGGEARLSKMASSSMPKVHIKVQRKTSKDNDVVVIEINDERTLTSHILDVGGKNTLPFSLSSNKALTAAAVTSSLAPNAVVSSTPDTMPTIGPKNALSIGAETMEHLWYGLPPRKGGYFCELLARTFPVWGIVIILIVSRVDAIGIKQFLTCTDRYIDIHVGSYANLQVSSCGVIQLYDIAMYPDLNWRYELLYLPFLVPFVLVSVLTMIMYRDDMVKAPSEIVSIVIGRLKNPALAFIGALVLVQLMVCGEETAPAAILGTVLADWFQEGFVVVCPMLGVLGSFFSGSNTVSNMTFGDIALIVAEQTDLSRSSMLALLSIGSAAGSAVALNNIVAACAVVGLGDVGEGTILVQTYKYVFGVVTIASAVVLLLFVIPASMSR